MLRQTRGGFKEYLRGGKHTLYIAISMFSGRSTNVQWSHSNPIYMKYNALHNTADSVSVWLLDVCYTAAQFTFTAHLLLVSLHLQ